MKARVLVRLKDGILDVPGTSVKRSLHALGFGEVVDVRLGKVIDVDLDLDDPAAARRRLEAMCERLLANPVIERCTIEIAPEGAPGLATTRGAE
ncbi:MAG TPA: phosphoribosylformylglycinamidine synthase subunit PurS [Candidatus Binatia bacterium]|jgi:phosphoribosylformylglycinamidine synthase|nr:phosphoribosylformylglycinamidine synthase subunit PurS [Candidatus Binatia bacterium]